MSLQPRPGRGMIESERWLGTYLLFSKVVLLLALEELMDLVLCRRPFSLVLVGRSLQRSAVLLRLELEHVMHLHEGNIG